ncbi:hypothetical protein, partial [Halopseudomonas bauzanensis]|uniref:hypothetical protein n=1 Tax=Halopseudomonas bauzanensis TaxID=653930 RepID=UPI0033060113
QITSDIELSGAGCTTAITPNQLVQSSSENDIQLGYSLAGQPSWLVFDLSTKLPQTIRREALRGSLTQDFK